jgi:hypothetical protein
MKTGPLAGALELLAANGASLGGLKVVSEGGRFAGNQPGSCLRMSRPTVKPWTRIENTTTK